MSPAASRWASCRARLFARLAIAAGQNDREFTALRRQIAHCGLGPLDAQQHNRHIRRTRQIRDTGETGQPGNLWRTRIDRPDLPGKPVFHQIGHGPPTRLVRVRRGPDLFGSAEAPTMATLLGAYSASSAAFDLVMFCLPAPRSLRADLLF